jgi:prepilin-type N-terminal cleavage/methylation domain-containing protein
MRQTSIARRAMTLVEMLVAMAASLILMALVARAFAAFSGAMSNSRAILETDSRLRAAARRLRDDLKGATAEMLPPINPGQGRGYFEVIEGPLTDYQDASVSVVPPAIPPAIASGTTDVCPTDIDDVLLFTTKNSKTPFVGRVGSGTMESSTAEVAWFARLTPGPSNPVTYTLYRKQMLVMGYMDQAPFTAANLNRPSFASFGPSWTDFYAGWPADISVRREIGSGFNVLLPNNLNDLTRRENRFLHNLAGDTTGAAFPYAFVAHQTGTPDGLIFDGTTRSGEDVVMRNVLAFDVRVFDPGAPVKVVGGTAVVPGDDFNDDGTVNSSDGPPFASSPSAVGAYVDLGNAVPNTAPFTGRHFHQYGETLSGLVGSATSRRTYCTWSTHYEANGIDEDDGGSGPFDEGTDGLDNDSNSLVDDAAEQETSPPYPYPLRGLEVRIRVYEPSSRQVRQVTVRHTFVPH